MWHCTVQQQEFLCIFFVNDYALDRRIKVVRGVNNDVCSDGETMYIHISHKYMYAVCAHVHTCIYIYFFMAAAAIITTIMKDGKRFMMIRGWRTKPWFIAVRVCISRGNNNDDDDDDNNSILCICGVYMEFFAATLPRRISVHTQPSLL